MKKFYFVFCFILMGIGSKAQNPEIYDTWYLYEIQISWFPDIIVADYQPGISPTLTIHENLNYEGFMACNAFSGSFHFEEDDLFFDEFNSTDNSCETEDLNDFETIYSYLFSGEEHFPMWLWENPNGELVLSFGDNASDQMTFYFTKSPILSSNEIEINPVYVHPNPAEDFLKIENAKPNANYQILSLNGEILKSDQLNLQGIIEIKNLSSGIYFLKMEDKTTKFIKK